MKIVLKKKNLQNSLKPKIWSCKYTLINNKFKIMYIFYKVYVIYCIKHNIKLNAKIQIYSLDII